MDEWISAYKATLFFDTPSQSTLAEFTQMLQCLTDMCGDTLHEAPSSVVMTEAARKQECSVCGSHDKEHKCIPHAQKPLQVQQQHKQPAPSKAPAAEQPVVVFVAPKVSTALLKGMCGEYRKSLVCTRVNCTQKHPEGWIIPPEGCCRDFYNNGECKYGANACKYKHLTLEDAQRAQKDATPASSAAAAAAPVPAVTASRAAVQKAPSNKKDAAPQQRKQQGRDSNTFAPLATAAAAAPSTPRGKVQTSSLSSLTSPSTLLARSHSTPSAAPPRKHLQFTTAKAAAASASASSASAAAAEDDGRGDFQQQKRRKKRKTEEQEEEKEQAPRKQPEAAAQQDQQQQQQSDDDDVMLLDQ